MRFWPALTLILIFLSSCTTGGPAVPNSLPSLTPNLAPAFTAPPDQAGQATQQLAPGVTVAPTQALTSTLEPQPTDQTMYISSPAFENGKTIPAKFSCQGENISPLLTWSGIPARAKSLALITEDPDAPSGTFYHWVIYNMQPSLTGLPEKVPTTGEVAGVGTQGVSGFGRTGYGGPCPPPGKAHRYYFTLYATDLEPTLPPGLNAAGLQKQIQGHILAQAQWMGTYQR